MRHRQPNLGKYSADAIVLQLFSTSSRIHNRRSSQGMWYLDGGVTCGAGGWEW